MLANAVMSQLISPQLVVKSPLGRFFFASVFAFIPLLSRALDLSEHTVSPSGEFVIYGGDDATRGEVSTLAEHIKADFLSILQRPDDWKIGMVVNLQSRAVNLPDIPVSRLRFSKTEAGFKLQLDLAVLPKTDPTLIERALAKMIVIEMMYRNRSEVAPGDVYLEPPAWLLDGLLASAPNKNRKALADTLSTLAHEIPYTEFLNQRAEQLDSAAREIYRGYSFALVQMLIDGPNGRFRLGRYIDNLSFATNDPVADLQAAFPEFSDFGDAWKAKIAELKSGADRDLLSFSQSNESLNQLLKTTFPSRDGHGESVSLESFSRTKPNLVQRRALQAFSRQLLLLATRSNPVLRPVIQDYQRIGDELALGRNRRVEQHLPELKSLHDRLSARMTGIDDYLNWFEAAKLETPSGVFDTYLRATTAADVEKPRRRDAVSIYLDAMELEF